MTQPILEITADSATSTPTQATPHLLPCQIHHNGPVGQVDAFWRPQEKGVLSTLRAVGFLPNSAPANISDGQATAYFRGRKLHGQTVTLPADYRGVVGLRRGSPREQARASNTSAPEEVVDVDATAAEQEAQRQRLDSGGLVVQAEFDKIVIWGHQTTADASTDPYVRSMEEWVALSEKIHSYE
ncbi:ribonuclease H2 subunit C [Sporothrix schenckii 1099-18]|uniref:Ribonuclease H2 subunit C n=1 Tax=Sporothrix schenckii 1099-18 TaxID=1397361 RepID=A0A0F2MFQ5_SPOSC|nr:ribonuclease H2 subunit C [Sporothrix schenckii 1099-18]KJR87919.1 ribonuclease H2 subunit C [Sporothrix schenckii 1099-18]